MRGVKHKSHEELTLLELVLQLHGEFRQRLESIRVTPLQAGVLLFLRRHAEANITEAAAALRVRATTLSDVVKDLVRNRAAVCAVVSCDAPRVGEPGPPALRPASVRGNA